MLVIKIFIHNHEDSPLTSSIVVEEHEASPIVTTSEEQTSPIPLNKANESNQEDSAVFDGNTAFVPYDVLNFKEAESSTTSLDPSNMHEFHQVQPSTHIWTKDHPLEQSQYAFELLKKHGMDECVSMSTHMATDRLDADLQGTPTDQMTYHQMIRGLMYLTASRPYIAFATFVCARYQARPTVKHLKEVKQIFCTSGGLQFLGEKLVSWSSKKQDCITMFTAEAKYVSLFACCAQVIWMRTQLLDYGYKYNRILMYCDSKRAIAISCNPVQHSCTKNIVIRYHFIKEYVEKEMVELYFVRTEYELADLFTKSLPKECFEYLVRRT
nr:hypothetical protein [Tanacetum cinerariifolium]